MTWTHRMALEEVSQDGPQEHNEEGQSWKTKR